MTSAIRSERQPKPKQPPAKEREDQLRRDLRAVRAELRRANARLDALSAQVADLKAGPVDRFVSQAVTELEDGPWGEVLTELHHLGESPDPAKYTTQDLLDQLLMLRPALFAALGIRPYETRPQIRIPTSRARSLRWGDSAPLPSGRHCTLDVISPGWARREEVLVAAKVRGARGTAQLEVTAPGLSASLSGPIPKPRDG
jgi:hypothetical protein